MSVAHSYAVNAMRGLKASKVFRKIETRMALATMLPANPK